MRFKRLGRGSYRYRGGTTVRVKVLRVLRGARVMSMLVETDLQEPTDLYHVLTFPADEHLGVERGDRGRITFTAGGPTGGYWAFERE